MVYREVAHHPSTSDHILRPGGVGERAEVGAEQRLPLGGGPHPLVQLVENDRVFGQDLHHVHGLQRPLPLQPRFLVEEVGYHFVGGDTLRGGGEGREGREGKGRGEGGKGRGQTVVITKEPRAFMTSKPVLKKSSTILLPLYSSKYMYV